MIDVRREDLIVMMEAGYLYVAMRKYDAAKAVFEGVAVLAPKSAVPVVAIGNVHFAKCQYARAIHYYKRALEIEAGSAFAKAYLGEALLFDGRKERAQALLAEAIAADQGGPTGIFAQSLLDLIDKGFDPYQLAKAQRPQQAIATPGELARDATL